MTAGPLGPTHNLEGHHDRDQPHGADLSIDDDHGARYQMVLHKVRWAQWPPRRSRPCWDDRPSMARTHHTMTDLAEPISGEEYMTVLLARQAAWLESRGQVRPKFPLLPEWFIQDGDEQWVQLPESKPAPKRQRKPRVYRSAESLREERDKVQQRMDAIANRGSDDPASVNLSPYSRSKPAARAGRKRFEQMDRDLERFTQLRTRLTLLNSRIAAAEVREAA